MKKKINNILNKMSDIDLKLMSRYFGLNEFNTRNAIINNLMTGGMPEFTQLEYSDLDFHDDSFPSLLKLFNTDIIVDEVTNEIEDTGAICVKLTFLNTDNGNETRLLKENDFKVLLSKSDYVNILSNFVFIPTHINPDSMFSCKIDIISRNIGKKWLQNGRYYLNTIAGTRYNSLTPNKNGLYMLLHCIIVASKFLYNNGFDILSLDLNSILHLRTRKGYLVTNYSIIKGSELKFSVQIKRFLADVINLYSNYNTRIRKDIQTKKSSLDGNITQIKKYKATGLKTYNDAIQNLIKINSTFKMSIKSYDNLLKDSLQSPVIKAVKDILIPAVSSSDLNPNEVYDIYMKDIHKLIQ